MATSSFNTLQNIGSCCPFAASPPLNLSFPVSLSDHPRNRGDFPTRISVQLHGAGSCLSIGQLANEPGFQVRVIVSQIIGGLGNQMFQYAAGRVLSLERGHSLRLDISGFGRYGLHQGFELQRVFNCPVEIATEADVRGLLGWQFSPGIRRVLSRPGMAAFRRAGFVVEPHFHFWRGIRNVPSDCYLVGYWQSEKYWLEQAAQIRADFSFSSTLKDRNAEVAGQINQVNGVSVHVRRGDYANNPRTNAAHGLCSPEYYQTAIQCIAGRVDYPHFFVFSDDVEWTREHLKLSFPCQYVDHNHGAESYNDMRLMSLCRYHIIANSSFSWWGAWLDAKPGKIVIAPKRWFADERDTTDLIPGEWIVL